MLAYPMEEAAELLSSKLEGAKQKMSDCQEDIDFLREQITVRYISFFQSLPRLTRTLCLQTLEVATARVYNWDVTERRKEREAGGGTDSKDAKT